MVKIFEKVKADKRIIVGYSASLFLLLITYLITLYANKQLKQRAQIVEHTYNVIANIDRMMAKITDGETGVRGYGITNDESFLEPYNGSRNIVDSFFSNLKQLTKDNAEQQQLITQLKPLIDERYALFKMSISMFKSNDGTLSESTKEFQLEGKLTMNKLRLLAAEMMNIEKGLITKRDTELKETFSSITTITILSLLLTLLLVVIGFITYTNENKARKIAMQNIKEYQRELNNRIMQLNAANAELKQMRSMEKFAATGRIARTIAHEVRNPLTNINLAASQLKSEISDSGENTGYLFDIINRNSERINKLISDLLSSTKFSELNLSIVEVNKLLDETLLLAQDSISLNSVIIKKQYSYAAKILADAEKLKIAFLNIIVNAVEAIKNGGGIIELTTMQENGQCIITIADNGAGMDEAILAKLFEPYFTSKQQGNGLGLTNTQNIIFNHKGNIHVTSNEGEGTTFTITLLSAAQPGIV